MELSGKANNGVYHIAEMSANHGGSIENALELVRAAKASGADCLKIQTYTADTITIDCGNKYFKVSGGLWDGYNLYELYKQAYTPWEWQKAIKDECGRAGIDFLSTPFDNTSVDFLEELGVEAYKIASFELVDIPLIEYAASKGKPVILSCGMASVEEIQNAVDAVRSQNNNDIYLLKCCSEYPADYNDMNVSVIPDMQERFGLPVGLSDHSMGSLAAIVAVSLGACIVEKHFCLSRKMKNPDSEFSMEPAEFKAMADDIKNAVRIRGTVSYELTEKEKSSTVFRRSLFAVKDIKRGEPFTKENIRSIRPDNGLKPKYYKEILGQTSNGDIRFGSPLSFLNISGSPKTDTFVSGRLSYKGIVESDQPVIVGWRSNKNLLKYSVDTTPASFEKQEIWFNAYKNDNSRFDYVISRNSDRKKIGIIGLKDIDYENHTGYISYLIGEQDEQSKGYATEAVMTIVQFAYDKMAINTFYFVIHPENIASLKVADKIGAKIMPQESPADDGRVFSCYFLKFP